MKIGVAYPSTEIAGDPKILREFIQALEVLDYDHMMLPDHVVKAPREDRDPPLNGFYDEKDSFADPFVAFGFAAAVTDKLEFVTGVLVLPQRQTALVAQQAADVDLLAGERLRLGVGSAGTTWNMLPWARNSAHEPSASKSRSACFASCGQNRWSASRDASTASTGALSIRVRTVRFPYGSVAIRSQPMNGLLDWRMDSSLPKAMARSKHGDGSNIICRKQAGMKQRSGGSCSRSSRTAPRSRRSASAMARCRWNAW